MKKVSLKFSSTQKSGDVIDRQSGSYTGTLRSDSGAYVLTYSEGSSGAGVAIRAQCDESAVKTERFAKQNSSLLIEKGKITRSVYKTDFGDMLLDITAKSIHIDVGADSAIFDFSYDISQNGKLVTHNRVHIKCKYLN